MNTLLLSTLVGIVVGAIDIVPMIIQKLPRYSIVSAFIHYFFVSIVIMNINVPYIPWWLEGGVVGLALMIPMLIHVAHADKKPLPFIAANAVVLGTAVGIVAHYTRLVM